MFVAHGVQKHDLRHVNENERFSRRLLGELLHAALRQSAAGMACSRGKTLGSSAKKAIRTGTGTITARLGREQQREKAFWRHQIMGFFAKAVQQNSIIIAADTCTTITKPKTGSLLLVVDWYLLQPSTAASRSGACHDHSASDGHVA